MLSDRFTSSSTTSYIAAPKSYVIILSIAPNGARNSGHEIKTDSV